MKVVQFRPNEYVKGNIEHRLWPIQLGKDYVVFDYERDLRIVTIREDDGVMQRYHLKHCYSEAELICQKNIISRVL